MRVKVPLGLPELAGALQDDPAALVDVLALRATTDVLDAGRIADGFAAHLPSDPEECRRLPGFLTDLRARLDWVML